MKILISLLAATLMMAAPAAVAQSQPVPAPRVFAAIQPKTTGVMVMLSIKQGVTPQQIGSHMPAEIRDTVKLYLEGKIRQWYSRGDGKGVIFLIDARSQDEAQAVMEALPLIRERLVDCEYIPVGPLMPLMGLLGSAEPR